MALTHKTNQVFSKHFIFGMLVLFCALFTISSSVQASWTPVEKVEGQCMTYRSIDAVGELFIYTEKESLNFVFSSLSPLVLTGDDDLVAFVKQDGFADYFDLEQYEDNVLNFSVPLSYFEKTDYRDIANVFFYVGASFEQLIPFQMEAKTFSLLTKCDGLKDKGDVLDNPVFFDAKDVAQSVIEAQKQEYDFSRLPVKALPDAKLEHEQTLEYVEETNEDERLPITPEDRDVPFFEEVQRHMQKNIFIPVASKVSEADISLDEQLEIIDSLTEKIKLLEIEKEYLRQKLGSNSDEVINVVADSKENP